MNEVLLGMAKKKKIVNSESTHTHLNEQLEQIASLAIEDVSGNRDVKGFSIKFAKPGERMRKVIRRSNYRMTGSFPSQKNGRMVHWESHYELSTFRLLEVSYLVKSYTEQPAMIRYNDDDGVSHLHYPDILVELRNGAKVFIEVKPQSAEDDNDLTDRTNILVELLMENGYHYLLLLPDQIESMSYLENARHLLLHSKVALPEAVIEKVRRIYSDRNDLQLSSLVLLLDHEYARSWIYRMIMSGDLACDLSQPLSSDSLLTWSVRGVA